MMVDRHDGAPQGESELAARMRAEGLDPHGWGNSPGDTYGSHEHSYEKVLYCVDGHTVFHTASGDIEFLGQAEALWTSATEHTLSSRPPTPRQGNKIPP
jgi:hypothetical protein